MILDLLRFFEGTYQKVFGFDYAPLHDPCAVAYVIAPEVRLHRRHRVRGSRRLRRNVVDAPPSAPAPRLLQIFETKLMRVDVECSGLCVGQTVCDIWHYSTLPKNVHVVCGPLAPDCRQT